ncbi:MAG: hypothetical protein QMC81_04020 [Thermoanaerobacterales bacterium]|nr:hypothetical protein [Thermoanaerobacterales bacterium]
MLLDTFRKLMLVSVGALSLTKEKAEQLVRELTEKGQVSTNEARKFVTELMEKGDKEREAIRNAVGQEVRRIREEWGIVTKGDLADLNARLARIEEHLFGSPATEPENTAEPGAAQ